VKDQPLLSVLRKVPYFRDLDPGVLTGIAGHCRARLCSAGEIVFMEGDPCLDLCVLESGRVMFYRINVDGREQVLKVFERPGDTFCIPSAFSEGRHIVSVKATAETRLQLLGIKTVNRIVQEHPSVGLKLIATAGEHMAHLVALAQDLALKSATARLAKYLLDMACGESAPKDGPIPIARARLREDDLASILGTVRVNVSRILKNLAREGAIDLDRKFIRILDLRMLKKMSEGK
jgi:CRP-like cAMP-binding protein